MKAIAVGLVLFVVGAISMFGGLDVAASDGLRWTKELPVVQRSVVALPTNNTSCPTFYQDIHVGTEGDQKTACMYGGRPLRLGVYYDANSQQAAIAFPYDKQMHVLRGVCEGVGCQYSADQDVLVTQQRISQFGWGVVVYAHVSERIKRITDSGSIDVRYEFDASSPDYELKNDIGQYIAAGSYAMSGNGRWLAVELRNKGTALIDTKTFNARQISMAGYGYGLGMDPTEEIAVSNDGLNVVVTGSNAGFSMFDVLPDCGQPLITDLYQAAETEVCPVSDLGIGNTFLGFHSAHRPKFSDDGDSLTAEILLWVQPSRKVMLGIPGSEVVSEVGMLALGDSFVSGEGENNESYYLDRTNSGLDTCHISRRSYPFLLGTWMGLVESDVKSVACAGARILDVTSLTKNYLGQGDRLALHTQVSNDDLKREAMHEFLPGITAQSSFVKTYTPNVITVGVGGNDAGLMGKLRVCTMPGTCEWATSEGRQKTAGEIKGLFDRLVALYGELMDLSPSSLLYAIGYPDIINPAGVCDPVTALLFTHDERVYMQESIRYLNQVISAAAAKSGIRYIDIQESFSGNKLCDALISPVMNGVVVGDDAPLISALPLLKLVGSGSFHPKPTGHEMIATYIAQDYPSLSDYRWCNDGGHFCPVDVNVPDPGEYWQVTSEHEATRAYADIFATGSSVLQDQLHIVMPIASILPKSTVSIEIRSDSTVLGTLIADQAGGIDGNVTIPASIRPGFHTLHLLGKSLDGGAIDVYQFVTISEAGEVESLLSTGQPNVGSGHVAQQGVGVNGRTDASNIGSVLGVQTQVGAFARSSPSGSPTDGAALESPAKGAVRHLSDTVWLWVGGGVILLGITLSILFIVQRSWVKRHRSV